MEQESVDAIFKQKEVENLMLAAVLGIGTIREKARQELQRRQLINRQDDFEDSFTTNLSVV